MKQNNCKNCGAEITNANQKVCVNCGAKLTLPIYKKWWFWVIVVLGVIIIASATGGEDGNSEVPSEIVTTSPDDKKTDASNKQPSSSQITYEIVDLQKMIDDLNQNAMKAESTYQNKYVQITAKIYSFDSDGAYITVEPVGADEWNFDTVMCYIQNNQQKTQLMEKSKGDIVTIKGRISSIGEVLGYSLKIDEIS